jgi:hypothetical protein
MLLTAELILRISTRFYDSRDTQSSPTRNYTIYLFTRQRFYRKSPRRLSATATFSTAPPTYDLVSPTRGPMDDYCRDDDVLS